MSTLLQLQHLSHSVASRSLFSELDLTIRAGDSIGLVGYNGSGKSTLLSLLAGHQLPDEGELIRGKELRLQTVEQFIDTDLMNLSLNDAASGKSGGDRYDDNSYHSADISEYQVAITLQQLGFLQEEYAYPVKDLSGGQQTRLMFARAILKEPNFILFDEPTNHLDVKTVRYFERFLQQMNTGFMLVSHDRDFLDGVTNRTLFLRDGMLLNFNLPYSQAIIKLTEADQAAEAKRREEEKSIQKLKASAKRLATWGKVYDNEKLARKAKNMEKRIDRLEESKTFVTRGSDLHLNLNMDSSRANRMLQIENRKILSPGKAPRVLIDIEDFSIKPGDRVALLGDNGAGKTTLISYIMKQYLSNRQSDEVKFNPQCRIGYYDQELMSLDESLNLLQLLREECPDREDVLVSALIKAGFSYQDHLNKVGVLSGGEKARLLFLVMQLNQPNFLILDEPTNHIDIPGREELEQQLLDGDATLLITSHDRRFINRVCTSFMLINEGNLTEINHPNEFWDQSGPPPSAQTAVSTNSKPTSNNRVADQSQNPDPDPEQILERIIEIEASLQADLQRKKKHQKPELQSFWEAEIDRLSRLL